MKLHGLNILKKQLDSGLKENNMKKKLLTLLTLSPLLLGGCVFSKYKAFILKTTKTTSYGSIEFDSFEGQYVFKLKRTEAGEGAIKFTASLGEGHVEVSFSTFASSGYQKMFEINAGETLNAYSGYLEKGYRVTIIVKSEGKVSNGSFTFDANFDLND